MGEDLKKIKERLPLLDYLQQHNWTARPVAHGSEFVGLCPLHPETRPSFYVNARKNLFYCHGCGQGGDLIRFVQLSRHLSFRQSLAYLEQQNAAADPGDVLEETAAFYQRQWSHYPEALRYLEQRGVHDAALLQELHMGYAPGGSLRRHLTAQGYSLDLLRRTGLVNPQGHDAFYRRVVFPCYQNGRLVNLYGRSIVASAPPHRFLPGSKGGLYAWEQVRQSSEVILVEGLFDYAVLWQAGFHHVTCSLGTHLTSGQFRQLCDRPRTVYLTFDVDANGSGQQAAQALAHRLRARGISTRRVLLPSAHDPNSFFVQGGDARQFHSLLEATPL
jgi:DNA primase catalytic core